MDVKNRIGNLIEIDWQKDLFELQTDNVKVPVNYSHLKQSILKHGFALPFAVWNDDGKAFCVDGHTRKTILTELISEGVKVPKKLKAFEVLAEDRKEAIQILIEVYNQKHNPFSGEIFDEWMEIESIPITEINMPSLNVSFDKFDGFEMEDFGSSYSDKNKEIDIDGFEDEMTLKFKYPENVYNQVKGKLSEIADDPETALLTLLKIDGFDD